MTFDNKAEFLRLAVVDWIQGGNNPRRLHAVKTVNTVYSEVNGEGVTECGWATDFYIPGFFSRMGMQRCTTCCKKLDYPTGKGSPKNCDEIRELLNLDAS